MKKQFTSLILLSFLFAGCASTEIKNSTRNDYSQSLNINRPAADIERDSNRKPKEVLEFANIKSGQIIVDYIPGSGYFTRIFSNVIGKEGKVYSLTPQLFIDKFSKGVIPNISSEQGHENNIGLASNNDNLNIPQNIDVFWTSQNYHDVRLYLGDDTTQKLNQAVFAALKSGGYYIILDHSGTPNLSEDGIKNLHRIDINTVIKEVTAAGFVLDASSDVLKNPADDLSLNVFDPAIRGKTDQFLLRFKKP